MSGAPFGTDEGPISTGFATTIGVAASAGRSRGSAAGSGRAAGSARFADAERVERRVLVVSALPTDRVGPDAAGPPGFGRVAAGFGGSAGAVSSARAAGAGLTPAGVAAAEAGVDSPEVAFAFFVRRFAVAALSSIFRFPGLVAR
jgi:hypothetical protein